MIMGTKTGACSHSSPGTPGVPEAGRGRKNRPPELLEGARPCGTCISDSGLQEGDRIAPAVLSPTPVCGH